jgi:hypothetical protein
MMQVTIKLVDDRLRNLPANLRRKGSAHVKKTALAIESAAKVAIMTGPKTGQMYGSHQASAKGEAPATDTGFLVNSIQTEEVAEMTSRVNVGAEYGAILEYIERPYLTPAAEGARPAWEAGLRELFND